MEAPDAISPVAPAPRAPAVTPRTPARSIGALPLATWRAVLAAADSPMLDEVEAIVEKAGRHGAMCLAQAYKESSLGKDPSARQTRNPFGIMVMDGSHDCLPVFGGALCLRIFPSWAAATADFRRRLGTVAAPYEPEEISLEEYLATYVGGPLCRASGGQTCANGETWRPGGGPDAGSINLYIWQTVDRLNQWLGAADEPEPGPHPHPDPGPGPIPLAGFLEAVAGAVARSRPARGGAEVRRLFAGERHATDAFTDGGEAVEDSPRWYRLAGGGWVHSSGGTHTAAG